jgi:protein JSN1
MQKGLSHLAVRIVSSLSLHTRARELEAEGMQTGRYRPPALRALATGSSPPGGDVDPVSNLSPDNSALPPTNYPAGFRRARAGTLPSNVQLAAQRFAAASNTLGSTVPPSESFNDQPLPQPTLGQSQPMRPSLRHATSAASPSVLSERNSRLRSGSLTLPSGNISNAFGSSLFTSSWLNGNGNGFPVLDELRSVTSMDSGGDDFDVHTLDYLGLDETHRSPTAATISELRSQAQAAIAGSLTNTHRVRASTVSNPYRMRPFGSGALLSPSNAEEEDDYYEDSAYNGHLDAYEDSLGSNNFLQASYVAQGFKQSDHLNSGIGIRPRAISVGNLDDSPRTSQRRATVADATFMNEMSVSTALSGAGGIGIPTSILKSDKLATGRGTSSPTVHFPNGEVPGNRSSPYLAAPGTIAQGGRLSPKSEGASNQLQTPTRSLWIGNLDSSVTSEQLIHVFAPYGAIESLRLLPEKVREPLKWGMHSILTLSLCNRSVDSSISSISRMRFVPKMMSSIVLEATLACRTVRPCGLGSEKLTVLLWRLQKEPV